LSAIHRSFGGTGPHTNMDDSRGGSISPASTSPFNQEEPMNVPSLLRRMRSVRRVTGSVKENSTFVYFLCPCLSNKGIMVDKDRGCLTVHFVPRLSGFTKARIEKVQAFLFEANKLGWSCATTAIWGSADSIILYPESPTPPPSLPPGLVARPNHEPVSLDMESFWLAYESQPWQAAPAWVLKQEEKRLLGLLPKEAPPELRREFVRRVFAGFILDGLLLSRGEFGQDPVILGVESTGVPVIQNIGGGNSIPIIQLT